MGLEITKNTITKNNNDKIKINCDILTVNSLSVNNSLIEINKLSGRGGGFRIDSIEVNTRERKEVGLNTTVYKGEDSGMADFYVYDFFDFKENKIIQSIPFAMCTKKGEAHMAVTDGSIYTAIAKIEGKNLEMDNDAYHSYFSMVYRKHFFPISFDYTKTMYEGGVYTGKASTPSIVCPTPTGSQVFDSFENIADYQKFFINSANYSSCTTSSFDGARDQTELISLEDNFLYVVKWIEKLNNAITHEIYLSFIHNSSNFLNTSSSIYFGSDLETVGGIGKYAYIKNKKIYCAFGNYAGSWNVEITIYKLPLYVGKIVNNYYKKDNYPGT